MSIITLTTDFGSSEYVGAMKGVILSINPRAKVVDITHNVQPYNVKQAAFVLYSTLKYFPSRSIHIAVVDPGVGTERRALILETEDSYLVGPDNGLFSLFEYRKAWEIEFKEASKTFHGRDVFAPAAAKLSLGASPEELGREIKEIEKIEVFRAEVEGRKIKGEVLHIDTFGNAITSIKGEVFSKLKLKFGDRVKVKIKEKSLKVRFLPTYGYAEKGEVLILKGSSGLMELSQNLGRASEVLNISPGDTLEIEAEK